MDEYDCNRLAMLVQHARRLIHTGRVGHGLDLLVWASEQWQRRCINRGRKWGNAKL